jgi:hypothetical protein
MDLQRLVRGPIAPAGERLKRRQVRIALMEVLISARLK